MLPGFRFLFAAIVLSMSILVFGLGAAALLRAAHEEFASTPSWRAAPETSVCPAERGHQAGAGDAARRYRRRGAESSRQCSGSAAATAAPSSRSSQRPAADAAPEPETTAALTPDDQPRPR